MTPNLGFLQWLQFAVFLQPGARRLYTARMGPRGGRYERLHLAADTGLLVTRFVVDGRNALAVEQVAASLLTSRSQPETALELPPGSDIAIELQNVTPYPMVPPMVGMIVRTDNGMRAPLLLAEQRA